MQTVGSTADPAEFLDFSNRPVLWPRNLALMIKLASTTLWDSRRLLPISAPSCYSLSQSVHSQSRREQLLEALIRESQQPEKHSNGQARHQYDVIVIGGGCTGSGAALDAASRGLRTLCIEKSDFGSGTSSRSTKLIWGGSRYLVQALIKLFSLRTLTSPIKSTADFVADFKMVLNCHRERKFLLQTQPHLTQWVPIAVPLKSWIQWPPPFNYQLAALGPLGLYPVFFKFVSSGALNFHFVGYFVIEI